MCTISCSTGSAQQTKGATKRQMSWTGSLRQRWYGMLQHLDLHLRAGRQSMRGPAQRSGYRYLVAELLAVTEALGGKRKAQVFLDISLVEPEELLKIIAHHAGIAQEH